MHVQASSQLATVASDMSARERARLGSAALAQLKGACECVEHFPESDDTHAFGPIAEHPDAEGGEDEADAESIPTDPYARIRAAIRVVRALHTATRRGEQRPESILQAAHEAHSRILLEAWASEDLQLEVASLCEDLWHSGAAGRESIASKLVLCVLARSLRTNAKADIKRVYALRGALELFQFEDESIHSLRSLLLRCCTFPAYTKSDEGRRFLSYLFNLHPNLAEHLMASIKNQIPTGSKRLLNAYADVLYRAWRNAAGPCLAALERELQSLGQAAVSASTSAMASNIRRTLDGFHNKKSTAGVDALLQRIYEPVLFRALTAANGNARRNAVLVLHDAFPIHDPSSSASKTDTLINKQLSELLRLLLDPCVAVRAAAITTSCAILDAYWEFMPSATASSIITTLADKCAKDSASPQARQATVKGFEQLVHNPRIASSLRSVLPSIGHALGDKSMPVRQAMADLLKAVSHVKAVAFYEVVPLEQIHVGLATDSDGVALRLTKLLLPSYFPASRSPDDQANRILQFVQNCPVAALRFCHNATAAGASADAVLSAALAVAAKLSETTVFDCNAEENTVEQQRQNKAGARAASERDDDDAMPSDERSWEYASRAVAELLGSLKVNRTDSEEQIEEVTNILAEMLQRAPTLRGKAAALRSVRLVLSKSSLRDRLSCECARNLSANDEAPYEAAALDAAKEALITACDSDHGAHYLSEMLSALKNDITPSSRPRKRSSQSRRETDDEEACVPPSREPTSRLMELLLSSDEGRNLLQHSDLVDDVVNALEQWADRCANENTGGTTAYAAMLAFGKAALHHSAASGYDAADEAMKKLVAQAAKLLRSMRFDETGRQSESHESNPRSSDVVALCVSIMSDASLLGIECDNALQHLLSEVKLELELHDKPDAEERKRIQKHMARLCTLRKKSARKDETILSEINEIMRKLTVSE